MNHIKELINNNNTDKAIELLSLAIANNPHCDEAYFLLGNAHCKKNDWHTSIYRKLWISSITISTIPNSQSLFYFIPRSTILHQHLLARGISNQHFVGTHPQRQYTIVIKNWDIIIYIFK